MSTTLTVATWTLLTVLHGGDVAYSPGFRTQHECLEARSLVINSRTLEAQKKHEDDAAAEAEAVAKAHPCKIGSIDVFCGAVTVGTWSTYATPAVSECIPVEAVQ